MKKILFFIQLPPPLHGVSKINQVVYGSKIINRNINKSLLEIKFSNELSELNKLTIKKMFIFLKLGVQLGVRIKKFMPDFVYFTIKPVGKGFYRDVFFVSVIKALGVKPIYHMHGKGIEEKIKNRVIKTIYNFVFSNSVVIHLSKGLIESEIIPLNLKNSSMYIVENGIECTNISNSLKKEDSFVRLLFLSNTFPSKGIFVLLEAFKLLSERFDDIKLDIAGMSNKNNDDKIDAFISNNLLTQKVKRHRYISTCEKYQLLENSDIFVLPTLNDAFPLALLEAMQFGLPVISTFEGGISEIVDEYITGFLVNQNNVQELAEKMKILIENDDLREKMGKKSRQKFLNEFTQNKFEQKMVRVFNGL